MTKMTKKELLKIKNKIRSTLSNSIETSQGNEIILAGGLNGVPTQYRFTFIKGLNYYKKCI